MRRVSFVPHVFDVIVERGAIVLHELVGEEEHDGEHAAAIAYDDGLGVILEYLVEEWEQIEGDVEYEEAVLPPLRVGPLVVDEIPEKYLFVKVALVVGLDVIDELRQMIFGEVGLLLFVEVGVERLLADLVLDPVDLGLQERLPQVNNESLYLVFNTIRQRLLCELRAHQLLDPDAGQVLCDLASENLELLVLLLGHQLPSDLLGDVHGLAWTIVIELQIVVYLGMLSQEELVV